MPTVNLKLAKCGDGYFRTFWRDDKGFPHTRSFGSDKKRADARFNLFHNQWRRILAVRNPNDDTELTLAAAFDRFKAWSDAYYVRADGSKTGETGSFVSAMRQVLAMFGDQKAGQFAVAEMKQARDQMVIDGLSVDVINARVRKIRQVFRWLSNEEIVDAGIWHALVALTPLKPGRGVVLPDGSIKTPVVHDPIVPVPEVSFWRVVAVLPKTLAVMVQLQYLTGMRPGEVCSMKLVELDTAGKVWIYRPGQHKTLHHGKNRSIMVGPKAQAILLPMLGTSLDAPIFSPRAAMVERCEVRVKSYVAGSGKGDYRNWARYQARERAPRGADVWKVTAYARAIARACVQADVPSWSPNQLRHNAATRLRQQFNLDVVQAVLGHSRADVTQLYAELDMSKAVAAMESIG